MQKTQSSKFHTSLNSFFLSISIGKGSSMLCLFSNLGPTPTCSKSVGIFILFNLMEGDSNLKLFDFGKQIKYTAQQRVRNVTTLYQRHISKQISLFPFQNNSDPRSVLLYPYTSFLKGPTTSSRHSTASHACHFFLFFTFVNH